MPQYLSGMSDDNKTTWEERMKNGEHANPVKQQEDLD
jgi:hypothetical protein